MTSRIIKHIKGKDRTAPPTPSQLAASVIGSTQINLSCAAVIDPSTNGQATSGLAGYRWWQLGPSGYTLVAQTTTRTRSVTGLSAGTTYYFKVSAIDNAGNESAQSDSVSATTDEAGAENRAPVWRDPPTLQIVAYPGDSVSVQITSGQTANVTDVWDLDGDSITFSETATSVLPSIGLSVSETGLISGTIPSDAIIQELQFRVRANDGQAETVSPWISARIVSTTDADDDWAVRSLAPGVFYANNCTDVVMGCEGYGRTFSTISSSEEMHTEAGDGSFESTDTGGPEKYISFRETDPSIVLSGTGVRCHRRLFRFGQASWATPVYQYAPTNYAGGEDSVPGRAGYRYNIAGGQVKYVETETDPTATDPRNHNPADLPCVRHMYIQWHMRLDKAWLYWIPIAWTTKEIESAFGMKGNYTTPGNKFVFLTGGQSSDQVAVTTEKKTGVVECYLNQSGTGAWELDLPCLAEKRDGVNAVFAASAVDAGTPDTSSATSSEVMLERYGIASSIVQKAAGFTVALDALPSGIYNRWQSITVTEAATLGVDPGPGSRMSAAWRGYPYGGFATSQNELYPDLNLRGAAKATVFVPDTWTVIEVLISDQEDGPVNDGNYRPPVTGPGEIGNPRFVAMWAARRGDPPTLLGYTNDGDGNGVGMIPARINDSNPPLFKYQDANLETYGQIGLLVLDSTYTGCMDPTDTQFDVIKFPTARDTSNATWGATTGRYTSTSANGFDPGRRNGVFGGFAIAFSRGDLADAAYIPTHPTLGTTIANQYLENHMQFLITSSTWLPAAGTVPDPVDGTPRYVHRLTLSEAMPVVPSKHDCCVVALNLNFNEGSAVYQADFPDQRMYYGELIFSFEPIPFPLQLDVPLPRPWRS